MEPSGRFTVTAHASYPAWAAWRTSCAPPPLAATTSATACSGARAGAACAGVEEMGMQRIEGGVEQQLPPALLRGDVQGTSDALDLFLTACIDPLADFLREEIVRKEPTMGASMLENGNDLVFDTKQIKHIDLISMANNVDKLIASGICSINDIMRLIGEKPKDDEFADKHYITKNYVEIDGNLLGFGGENE